eukprot:7188800-Lingulodinium_polyedra.AAC.1
MSWELQAASSPSWLNCAASTWPRAMSRAACRRATRLAPVLNAETGGFAAAQTKPRARPGGRA